MVRLRIVVLFLDLCSLGGVLFTIELMAGPLLLPSMLSSGGGPDLPWGCFLVMILILLLPLSLMPSFVGWMIRERFIRPREAAEQSWWAAEPSREKQLFQWMGWFSDLRLTYRTLHDTPDDPVPVLTLREVSRGIRGLDARRRQRLLFFLSHTGLEAGSVHDVQGTLSETATDSAPPPNLALVAAGFSLASGFILLYGFAGILGWYVLDPEQELLRWLEAILAIDLGSRSPMGRLAPYLMGVSPFLIGSLLSALAAAGLTRIHRQSEKARAGDGQHRRQEVERETRENAVELIERLGEWRRKAGHEADSLIRRLTRATVLVVAPELDGPGRGRLVELLFRSGWITGEAPLDLAGAYLQETVLAEISMPGVCLPGTDLSGANLQKADLRQADLRGCIFRGSDLRSCLLTGARLWRADLGAARLQSVRLENADLREAFVEGANFWGAHLEGADLAGIQGSAEFFEAPLEGAEENAPF